MSITLAVLALTALVVWVAASPVRFAVAVVPVVVAHPTLAAAVTAALAVLAVLAVVVAARVLWRELAGSGWLLIHTPRPAQVRS